jgi:pyruvate,orthophosphate dikinase
VREEALTADIAGLAACAGLLTLRGSRTAHAAVVARQLGKPCLVGCGPMTSGEAALVLPPYRAVPRGLTFVTRASPPLHAAATHAP